MSDEILFVEDVTALLRVDPSTLRTWRSTDRGPVSFRIGRKIAYSRADVEAWVERQKAATARGGAA